MKLLAAIALILFLLIHQAGAQDMYRTTRSLEIQQAISHIGQADYYISMALRSLESSEKAGRAPFFDYKRAREDLKRIQDEFKTYLGGEGSPARTAAIPLIIDGRYFADSIKEYLTEQRGPHGSASRPTPEKQKEVEQSSLEDSKDDLSEEQAQTDPPNVEAVEKEKAEAVPPPVVQPKTEEAAKREKIEEILKKGL